MEDNWSSLLATVLCLLAPFILVAFGFIGRAILGAKGYSKSLGFVLGAVGSIIGIIIALILPKATQPQAQPQTYEIPEDFEALVFRMLEVVKESDRWTAINGVALFKDHPQYGEAQAIGKKLFEMGGRDLMAKAYVTIEHYANRSGTTMAQHWWNGIGGWQA